MTYLYKVTIPEFPEIFPGIELVSIIYVRYCEHPQNYILNLKYYLKMNKISAFLIFEKGQGRSPNPLPL